MSRFVVGDRRTPGCPARSGSDLEGSLGNLDHALSLDRDDVGSQRLLRGMLSALHGQGLQPFAPGEDVRPAEQTLQNLGARYVP